MQSHSHHPGAAGTEPGAQAITPTSGAGGEPTAVFTIAVQRDRIQITASLLMGGSRRVSRVWHRVGVSSWRSVDPEFVEHEERIGLELAEFADAIDLPGKVADMLPRRPASGGEVGHA